MIRTFAIVLCIGFVAPTFAAATTTVSVDGPGCLRFIRDGRTVYAKKAVLTVIGGVVCEKSGPKLVPGLFASGGLGQLTVALDGKVKADGKDIGTIVLAVFPEEPKDTGFFSSPTRPELSFPGQGDTGVIRTVGAPPAIVTTKQAPTLSKESPVKPAEPAVSRLQILMGDRVEVDVESFTLGDIATIHAPKGSVEKLGAIVLGDTPPIGVERIVDQRKILSKIQAAGFDPATVDLGGPIRTRVVRKGQTLSNDQFVEAAIRGASVQNPGLQYEAALPGPAMTAPVGTAELVCENLSGTGSDLMATIGVYIDGKRFNGRSVKLRSTSPASSLKAGAVVPVKVMSHGVSISCSGKVVKVDPGTGQVTVKIDATGAQLVGIALADGSIEVKA
ncbi:MAG: hypothetical protein JSS66_12355 [Armatimonadetes bacterium]|nr:hypothetical protein [Armatimonadota bacterium]